MAVRPQRVPSARCSRWVEHRLLSHQNVGPLGNPPARHRLLGGHQLGQRPADVHGPGFPAGLGAPWDRAIESPVDLEDSRSVAEPAQRFLVTAGKARPRDQRSAAAASRRRDRRAPRADRRSTRPHVRSRSFLRDSRSTNPAPTRWTSSLLPQRATRPRAPVSRGTSRNRRSDSCPDSTSNGRQDLRGERGPRPP